MLMCHQPIFQHEDVRSRETVRQATIVHHHDKRGVWATSGRQIIFRMPGSSRWKLIGQFPFVMKRELFGWNRITQRLARADKCLVYPMEDGSLVGIRSGSIYHFEGGRPKLLMSSLQGDCPLHRSLAEPERGVLYFGEYLMNPDRDPVRIIRIVDGGRKWEVAYTFGANEIRHVHGVYVDPFVPKRIWVTTGDLDGENYLFYTDDHFKNVCRLGDGGQLCRAVGLLFSQDYVAWVTDSPMEQNYSMRLDRKTGELIRCQALPSSFWYTAQTTNGLFLAGSSVEKGPAIRTNLGSVWRSEDGLAWERMVSFVKDSLAMPWFKWGTISFPSGVFSSDEVWISGEALSGLDGISRCYSFSFR